MSFARPVAIKDYICERNANAAFVRNARVTLVTRQSSIWYRISNLIA